MRFSWTALVPASVVAIGVGGISWAAAVVLLPRDGRSDVTLYAQYAEGVFAGGMPYRDVQIEYPPGALPVFLIPRLAGASHYHALFHALMAVCGVVVVVAADALMRRQGFSLRRRLATGAGLASTPLVLGQITFERYDLLPSALVLLALVAGVDRRWVAAGALLGAATSAKLYPAVLLPVLLLFAFREMGRGAATRMAVGFVALVASVQAAMLVLAGSSSLVPLEHLAKRPLQIESTGSALLLVVHQIGGLGLGTVYSYGSTNLGGNAPRLVAYGSGAAWAVGCVVVIWLFSRVRPSRESFLLASSTMLVLTVALGKVFSPQYMLWLAPAVCVLTGRKGALLVLAVGLAAILTNAIYPGRYPEVEALQAGGVWLVVTRDVLLALVAIVSVASLWREPNKGLSGYRTALSAPSLPGSARPAAIRRRPKG